MRFQLRDYQQRGVDDLRAAFRSGYRAPLLSSPTGSGKCLGRGTPVLMYDGMIKAVEDVQVGDLLMGPDSQPRTVLSTCRGAEPLHRVTPVKGDPYVVNESHILSLKRTGIRAAPRYPSEVGGGIVNISVREYLARSATFRHEHKGWRAAVDFPRQRKALPLPPYILGAWLGDGASHHVKITTADTEIADEFARYARQVGMAPKVVQNSDWSVSITYNSAGRRYGRRGSPFGNALRELGVWKNKHVPHCYRVSTRKQRLEFLAGILDTDGHWCGCGYSIVQKNERLLDGIIFIARSLGFSAYKSTKRKTCGNNGKSGTYYEAHLNGPVDEVPCRVPRKQAPPRKQKKNPLATGIRVEPMGEGEYFGFEIDGPDRLFLLGDFTVTHNTVMFSHIAEQASQRSNAVMILVHRRELLAQTSKALNEIGVRHQLIAPYQTVHDVRADQLRSTGSSTIDQTSRLQVASVQTLVRRLDKTPPPDLIVIDECHHAVAGSWARVVAAFPRARLLGVTATPHRLDGRGLGVQAGGPFDTLVEGPTVRELIDAEHLCQPVVYAPPMSVGPEGIPKRGGDYATNEQAQRLDKPRITGDAIDHYRRICDGAPAIAFCANVAHAQHVAEQFRQSGYRWQCVDGTMSSSARDRAIRGLGDGSLHGISSCEIVNEGTDVPIVAAGILLRWTTSLALFLQQCGRILRPYEGKARAIILDHVGNSLVHGLPDWDREWSLEGEEKRKGGKKAPPAPPVWQCPQCYAAHEPADRCPMCGHVYAQQHALPQEEEGELTEVTPEQAEAMRRARKREVAKATTYEDLKRIEAARGYKPGWADHVFAAKKRKRQAA